MIDKQLKKALIQKNVVLFVGAGVSASLGLPTWQQLIEKMGNDLGYDPELFVQYGDNLMLAEYYEIEKSNIRELSKWMKTHWSVSKANIKKSAIHKAIVDLNVPIIYTTNYDHCIEAAFDAYKKRYLVITNVDDITRIRPNTTQIIKFHGDMEKEDSIILSESSYFNRLNFESPLDIKLRADILGKTILFVGYSISDINIRLLLYKLYRLWDASKASNRPKSYVFLPTPNAIQERILTEWGITPIVGKEIDVSESTESFLSELVSVTSAPRNSGKMEKKNE